MRAIIRAFVCLLAMFFATAIEVRAQGFQGGIRGAIKDPTGVIPGAEVTVTNEETNVSRSTATNSAGEYSFPNLAPGPYTLNISLQGYKSYVREGIRVGTQQFITLDITLDVGALQETVTVTAEAPLIETSNASTGTVLNYQALQTLPSPGRAAFLIGTTVPTVIPSAVQSSAGSDECVAPVARRRRAPRQQLHARRGADHRPAQSREREPDDRSARGHEGAGAHL